jgi:hypothetical protein
MVIERIPNPRSSPENSLPGALDAGTTHALGGIAFGQRFAEYFDDVPRRKRRPQPAEDFDNPDANDNS